MIVSSLNEKVTSDLQGGGGGGENSGRYLEIPSDRWSLEDLQIELVFSFSFVVKLCW